MKKTKRSNSRGKIRRQPSASRRSKKTDTQALPSPETMPIVHPNAGGIDVSSKDAYVCVPQHAVKAGEARIRSFGVFSQEMDALAVWLKDCGVDTVAMEATGIYWVVLYDKLEAAGVEVVLVNPRYVKHVPGRKSDVLDCQWLQQLHMCGLLSGSFRPAAAVRYLRTLMRQRQQLTRSCGRCVQQMQKALVQMNVQLNLVVSDIDGDTGLRIIRAILAGERNPKELVKLRDDRITKSTPEKMEAALQGEYHPEQLFLLQQGLQAMEFYQRQMDDCDNQIAQALESLAPARPPESSTAVQDQHTSSEPPAKRRMKKKSRGNAPKQDLRPRLEQITGVDLTRVPGLNMLSVLILISEIGLDMSKWRNEKAFCSWLGLCPAADISGGKVLSRGTRHVVNRAATVLRVAATAAGRTETWLGSFYRRKRAHLGAPKAITATARKLACVIYHMLKQREEYLDIDTLVYEAKAQQHRLCRLRKQAQILGFDLVQRAVPA